jgi:hypothetical protein
MCTGVYDILHDFAGPVATTIASIAAFSVAWRIGKGQLTVGRQQADTATQQAHIAAVRLQHDLFDRRFGIYEEVQKLCIEATQRSNITSNTLRSFVINTDRAVFLFDQHVADYLKQMQQKAMRLMFVADALADGSTYAEALRDRAAEERAELATWFNDELEILVDKFRPFLALEQNMVYPSLQSSKISRVDP